MIALSFHLVAFARWFVCYTTLLLGCNYADAIEGNLVSSALSGSRRVPSGSKLGC